ncbi:MAG: aromatic ring-hydroxylating dioxygenase subunit alpha [Gammaproteobacteria bacterium]|nr:aromatic ring-hydroxylating dioxygenase subunit alpha [Gammaproteobacteria bacterium]
MLKEEKRRVLRVLRDGIANGTTHFTDGIVRSPVDDFTSQELLTQEQQIFFKDTPLFVGLTSDLPKSGNYKVETINDTSILFVRDPTGRFRAFANVCRHRGAQVVPDGKGRAERFSCPFHAWTYTTEGRLIAVNRESSFGPVCKEEYPLVELPAAEKYGMLWCKSSPGGKVDVDDCLGGLGEEMGAWGLDKMAHSSDQVIDAKANWKLVLDTFGENYHFDVLHRNSLAPQIKGNLQTHDIFGMNYRMVFAYQNWERIVADIPNEEDWPFFSLTLTVYFIYPNAILLVDYAGCDVLRMHPVGDSTSKSNTYHSWYLSPRFVEAHEEHGVKVNTDEKFHGFNSIIRNEDYLVAESTQRSANSGAISHVLFGRNEPALHHYHNAHRRGLNRPALEPIAAG